MDKEKKSGFQSILIKIGDFGSLKDRVAFDTKAKKEAIDEAMGEDKKADEAEFHQSDDEVKDLKKMDKKSGWDKKK